jgi:hypothetical protein
MSLCVFILSFRLTDSYEDPSSRITCWESQVHLFSILLIIDLDESLSSSASEGVEEILFAIHSVLLQENVSQHS